jgi:hypothetical protein
VPSREVTGKVIILDVGGGDLGEACEREVLPHSERHDESVIMYDSLPTGGQVWEWGCAEGCSCLVPVCQAFERMAKEWEKEVLPHEGRLTADELEEHFWNVIDHG